MKDMIIKVCGLRDARNIQEVAALGVDMLGFIFWPQSPRYVQMVSSQAGIIPDYSRERLHEASWGTGSVAPTAVHRPQRVGVFVDDMPQNIITRVYNYHLDYVQLHGHESPVMVDNLRRTLIPDIAPDIKVIKAVSVASAGDLRQTAAYEGLVDLFLFDTKCATVGGSGEQFDWSVLDAYEGTVPFLLSGGIGPGDAARVRAFRHPRFAGIDLNSRFETAPGMKDVGLLQTFIKQVRNEQD